MRVNKEYSKQYNSEFNLVFKLSMTGVLSLMVLLSVFGGQQVNSMNDYVVYYWNSEMEMVTDHFSANTVEEVLEYYYNQPDVCEVDNVELVD